MTATYIDNSTEQSNMASEPAVAMMIPKATRPYAGKRKSTESWMRAFVSANYDAARAKELEAQNFLVGTPFIFDEIRTEQDWEQIEQAAAESGEATPHEVAKVFDRWLGL